MTVPRSSGCTRTSSRLPRRESTSRTRTSSGFSTMPLTRCSSAGRSAPSARVGAGTGRVLCVGGNGLTVRLGRVDGLALLRTRLGDLGRNRRLLGLRGGGLLRRLGRRGVGDTGG